MKSSLVTLRRSPAKILDAIEARQEVTLTRRGKPFAKVIPYTESKPSTVRSHAAFGMWKNESTKVDEQVRQLRKGRQF